MILTHALDISICIFFIIISYFIGSIPFGVLIGKFFAKKDIRNFGSKNIGSTNAVRVLGKKLGALVFFLDVFKGMFIIIIVGILDRLNIWTNPIDIFIYGFVAILGHCYSIFLGFTGGKAVATSLGVISLLTPLSGVSCLIVFVAILLLTGYVSLASTGATITVALTAWLLHFIGIENPTNIFEYFISSRDLLTMVLYTILALLILSKHTTNYKRLLNHTENKFNFKKKK